MIRKIEEKDIPVILNWYNWYIRNSNATFETEELTLDELKQRVAFITEKYPWIILEEDGKPVGYAYYSDFNSRQAYACTVDLAIYLDPNACHHGYGKILMNEMIVIARKSGYKNSQHKYVFFARFTAKLRRTSELTSTIGSRIRDDKIKYWMNSDG